MKDDSINIPIIEPDFPLRVDFDKSNRITNIDIDWKKFYNKMDREEQIDMLECILGWLKSPPNK